MSRMKKINVVENVNLQTLVAKCRKILKKWHKELSIGMLDQVDIFKTDMYV